MSDNDNILMKDLTPEKMAILESKLRKEDLIPEICEGRDGYANMLIPVDENTKLSGTAAALLPFQEEQSETERLITAELCANQILNIALILQKLTEESFSEMKERDIVANSILQRALSYHISNLKLTSEGICIQSEKRIQLINDCYKALPLTRSVYELLVTFFGLFILNKTEEEKEIAFNCWKINSEKNAVGELDLSNPLVKIRQNQAKQTIDNCKNFILSTNLGKILKDELIKELSAKHPKIGTIYFCSDNNNYHLKRLSFASAWKFMTNNNTNLEFQYRMLSMHSHPIHWGLSMFANQSKDSIEDAILGLHFSTSFLAKLLSYYKEYFGFDELESLLTDHQVGILNSMCESM